ncbi:tetratricopeptide repeat protein 27 [Arctopsyche grandis]|uniref:tetratricopeptide repeat protein 27 n=1 Tax=Arctopsyche grandis TaxID=121162 RepID=UPI00406D7312
MLSKLDSVLLCNFDEDLNVEEYPEYVKLLWNGSWSSAMDDTVLNILFNDKVKASALTKHFEQETSQDLNRALVVAIASINAFCEINWTGPNEEIKNMIETKWPSEVKAASELALDGEEICPTILCSELLMIAMEIFKALPESMVCIWWQMRFYYLYQKVLEELSPSIFKILENLTDKLLKYEESLQSDVLKSLLNLELNQVYLLYGRVQNSEVCLQKAKSYAGVSLELKGALGKRTKFQQEALPQLNLDIVVQKPESRLAAAETHPHSFLMVPLKLDDDLRLENIQFLDIKENATTELTSVEQMICLNTIQYLQRSQPKDTLADEELLPYVNILLSQKHGPWATRICSLLIKCKLENNNKRTVERAMMQCEEIVNSFNRPQPTVISRLSYIWSSGLSLAIDWRSQLADLLLSIGLVKAALDLYLKLQLWEEVIACYTILELRHKAAEIIQQQIDIKPTVKLYCLLGDATDNVKLYERAWDFSQRKSSRAQRHWGNYLFSNKKYEECIPHYQKSCEINSLQESVWLRLGYAALVVENWELSATAYRRYTYLEPNSFEAWNNLAKVYVKQGNKERAHKALSEALKYNYDNWQVWENMLIVSLDTGHFDDVIRSYHRILDLRTKHLDVEVLTVLVKAILENTVDVDGNASGRLIPKALSLFGRISSVHPNDPALWQLYADISPNALLKGQRLLKSYAKLTQTANWGTDVMLCEKVSGLAESIAIDCLELKSDESDVNRSQIVELLSSARLTVQAVVRVLSKEKLPQYEAKAANLQLLLDDLTIELKKRMS